jgi:CHAD domain-containing protein
MEIESKYAVTGPLAPADLEAVDLHLYRLRPTGEERHHDVLLDTPARALTSHGCALRLRHFADGRVLATYKGANNVSGATHERDEVEAEVAESAIENGPHFPPAIAERITPLAGDAPLGTLVETDIHRQTWHVLRDDQTVAEIALDNGSIIANGLTAPVRELEVELKEDGTHSDLEALDKLLTRQLPLRPEPQSKLERGLALLDRERVQAARRPLEDATHAAVKKYLADMRKHEPEVREGTDPEGVHKMRVATRRLRTTLGILEAAPTFDPQELRRLRRGLRRLARALGEVRDFDVRGERVRQYREAQPDLAADLSRLTDQLEARNRSARKRLLKCLDSSRLARTLEQLDAFAEHPSETGDGEPTLLVRHFAGSAIWARYEAVLRYETVAPDAPPETLHQVRIACKQLRYATEMFEDALGERVQPLLEVLVRTQDHLGELHDAVVALDMVSRLNERHPARGLAVYAAALAAERDRLHQTFAPLWVQISGEDFHRDLLGAVGSV